YRRRAPSPVAERYFEAARRLDTRPDGGPPEFCLGSGATDRAAQWLAERGPAEARLAALAPGAAHATKRWPVAHWSALAERAGTAASPLAHHRCLADITPEEVAAAVERLVA